MLRSCSTRHVPYVVLKVKGTSLTFGVFNVHFDHESEEARRKSAALLVSKTKGFDIPCILCGDFNCRKESPVSWMLCFLCANVVSFFGGLGDEALARVVCGMSCK